MCFNWTVTNIKCFNTKNVSSNFISNTTAIIHYFREHFLRDFYSANNAFRPNTFLHVIGDTPVDFLSDSRVELKVLVEVE